MNTNAFDVWRQVISEIVTAGVCFFLLTHSAQAAEPMTATPEATPERTVYKTTPQGELALFTFRPASGSFDGLRPAVLFFHGGGWVKGNPAQFYEQSRALAARGVVAINAEYRIKGKHETTPIESVRDAFSAMRFVREHAEEWKLDPKRIVAGGGSAGGHLAAALATLDPARYLDDGDTLAGDALVYRPDALVLYNPVYDVGPKGYGRQLVGGFWPHFSPAHNLHRNMPPTLVMVGDQDRLLPVSTAESFRDRMRELGVRSELIVYAGQSHGFFNKPPGAEETTRDLLNFLDSLSYLAAK